MKGKESANSPNISVKISDIAKMHGYEHKIKRSIEDGKDKLVTVNYQSNDFQLAVNFMAAVGFNNYYHQFQKHEKNKALNSIKLTICVIVAYTSISMKKCINLPFLSLHNSLSLRDSLPVFTHLYESQ